MQVYEGDSKTVEDCHYLARAQLTDIKPVMSEDSNLVVTMSIDDSQIVTMEARDFNNANSKVSIRVKIRGVLSKEQLQEKVQRSRREHGEVVAGEKKGADEEIEGRAVKKLKLDNEPIILD